MSEIAAASHEPSAGVEQVDVAVASLDDVTQQNAALVEEASAASRQALELGQELMRQVAFFKIDDSGAIEGSESRRPVRMPANVNGPSSMVATMAQRAAMAQ